MAEKTDKLSRSAGIISFASAVSRLTGLLNILVVARALGWGRLQDSYNLANVMPNMLFELVAGGILTSLFIPVFVAGKLHDEKTGWRVASNIINISLVLLVFIAAIGTIFSYYFVRAQTFLVPTAKVSVHELNFFFKFFIWEIVFYGLTAIINGVLQAYRRFTAPAFAPIFNNLVAIATILFWYLPLKDSNPRLALIGLAVGTTLGVAAMMAVQLPALWRVGFKYAPVVGFRDPAIRQLGLLAVPIIGYVVCNQVGMAVSNALAWKFDGGMTAFTIAWRFFQMPYGLLAVSISTVLFPGFSEQAASDDMLSFKKSLLLAVSTTAFIIIPASVVLFLLSHPIINFIFGTNMFFGEKFDAVAVNQTAGVMSFFMAGLLPFSIYMLLTRVFYALKDTHTPMKVNAVGVPLNIALNFALVGVFGVPGLSMGHSLTYLFTMTLLFLALRKKIGAFNGRLMLENSAKFALISAGAGVIMILIAISVKAWVLPDAIGDATTIIVAAGVGGLFYFLVSRALGAEEAGFLTSMIRGIFIGRRA